MECAHLLLNDYLPGVCQQILRNTQYEWPLLGGDELAFWNAGFHQLFFFGMAVGCGQWNNRP